MTALPKLLCLVGPTGSGKTAAALYLAAVLERAGLPVTVINAVWLCAIRAYFSVLKGFSETLFIICFV